MNRKQRFTLVVGTILIAAAILAPPWSYYRGEMETWWMPGVGPRQGEAPPPPENPFLPRFGIRAVYKPLHEIRGFAIFAIFIGTILVYLKCGSQPLPGEDEAALVRQPGRATQVFWAVTVMVVGAALIIPFVLLLMYVIRTLRG
jgi:hypothetical protein